MGLLSTLPFPLGSLPSGAQLYEATGLEWDCAVGGIPFMIAATADEPLRRSTMDFTRQQIDFSETAGEQSLSGWWLRSQRGFGGGAGIAYLEPLSGDGSEDRFDESVGVDVFTDPTQISLCKAMEEVDVSGLGDPVGLAPGPGGSLELIGTTNYGTISAAGAYSTGGAVETGAASIAVAPDGSKWVAATGAIYKDGVSTYTYSGSIPQLYFLKNRLFATKGGDLYELDPTGSGALASETPLSIPNAVNTVSGWEWKSVVATPGAIWAVGSDGLDQARVFVITIDDTAATVVFERLSLPLGEELLSSAAYFDYIILGTSAGMRICPTQDTQAALGPSFGVDPITSITAFGDSVYGASTASHDGATGVMRVDLSTENQDGFFAWAKDTYVTASAAATALAALPASGRLVLTTAAALFLQSATAFVEEGRLRTGLIRWGTLEKKWFHEVAVDLEASGAPVAVSTVINGSAVSVKSFVNTRSETATLGQPSIPAVEIALEFTLRPAGGVSGALRGYQLRAVPSPRRRREIILPVRILDGNVDRRGNRFARENFGMAQQFGLEAVEEAGAPVYFQDFRTGEQRRVIIQKVIHGQPYSPDGPYKNAEGQTILQLVTIDKAQLVEGNFVAVG